MFVELLLVFGALLAYYLIKQNTKPHGFPPGPTGVPVVGYLPFMGKEPEQKFRQLAKKYGDITGIIVGNKKVVVLNNLDTIKEAYKEEVFSGRPSMDLFNDLRSEGKSKGVIFVGGKEWHDQRRFVLRHLRDFGFGKKSLESVIAREVSSLIQEFRKDIGKPIQLDVRFHLAVINTLWSLIASKRLDLDDPKLIKFFENNRRFSEISNIMGLFLFVPWLFKMLPNSMSGMDIFQDMGHYLNAEIDDEIATHEKTLDKDNARDLIDAYLIEISKTTESTSGFYKRDGYLALRTVVFDLFVAGTETTSSTLQWLFMMLLKHPEVKSRVEQEIQAVVGSERSVTLADRSSMPYTEATILETLRYSSLIPLSLPHLTTQDKVFEGYHLPKGTVIIGNLFSVHYDPKHWDDPQSFNPERFLTSDGSSLKRSTSLVPFASGKRICIGEKLSQDEIFLFVTNILQQLDISVSPGESTPVEEYIPGFSRMPAKYNIVFSERRNI